VLAEPASFSVRFPSPYRAFDLFKKASCPSDLRRLRCTRGKLEEVSKKLCRCVKVSKRRRCGGEVKRCRDFMVVSIAGFGEVGGRDKDPQVRRPGQQADLRV